MSGVKGWSWRLVSDGALLESADGRGRVWHRQRPLRPMVALVHEHVARHHAGELDDVSFTNVERIETREGCYAALTTMRATGRGGKAVELDLAFIFGEDFYDLIELTTNAGDTIKTLVTGWELGVDDRRTMRYLYTPPAGWQGLARGQITEWFPPEFQRDWAYIVVPPTLPGYHTPASLADRVQHYSSMAGFTAEEKSTKEPITTDAGLFGLVYRWPGHYPDGRRVLKVAVSLSDRTHIYAARLEVAQANPDLKAHEETFLKMVRSIQPLPKRASEEPDVFVAWRG
jgi:hypothetical protein